MRSSPEGWLMGLGALLAGMCARRRSHFLLSRQKKVTKEKATPLALSLRFAAGSLRCSVAGRRCGTRFALARSAQTTAASQSTKHGLAAQPMPAPRPALLGTARGEVKSTRAIAALGLWLVSAAASRGVPSCPLSHWRERVGVRATRFKNNSCMRLIYGRYRHFPLEFSRRPCRALPGALA